MANAKKCDRCGRFYDYYGMKKSCSFRNAMTIYYKSKENIVLDSSKNHYDLCPLCMEQLVGWLTKE